MRGISNRRVLAIFRTVAAGAMLWTTSALHAQNGPPPANVHLDAVRLENISQRREVTGSLRAVQRSRVAAKEDGLVLEVPVEAGDDVKAGQVLVHLDDEVIRIELERLRSEADGRDADIELRQSELAKAERDLLRVSALVERQGASQNELDDATTNVRSARARLAAAEAELASAKANIRRAEKHLADMVVRAPFDGSIVEKTTEVGEWIRSGESVMELVALATIDAFLDVPQQYIGAVLQPNATMQLHVEASGDRYEAPVSNIIVQADSLARTFPVRVRLENPTGSLRPGMSVTAYVLTGERGESLTIHKDAILRDDAGAYVYYDAGGIALPARIEPLFASGDRYVIRSSQLRPGMMVVTEGNERLFPTQPLNVLSSKTSAATQESNSPALGSAGG